MSGTQEPDTTLPQRLKWNNGQITPFGNWNELLLWGKHDSFHLTKQELKQKAGTVPDNAGDSTQFHIRPTSVTVN